MGDIVRDIMKLRNPEGPEAANATDTNAEAVKQLIAGANGIPAFAAHNDTLRALLAERDRLWEQVLLLEATGAEASDEIERLRAALQSVLGACDQGRMVERGAGGMTLEAQIRRSVYNNVPAWPIEEARAALKEAGHE